MGEAEDANKADGLVKHRTVDALATRARPGELFRRSHQPRRSGEGTSSHVRQRHRSPSCLLETELHQTITNYGSTFIRNSLQSAMIGIPW